MTKLQAELQHTIAPYDLLKSRFYQAWSKGTLPLAAIREYANEYGAFIKTVADGWEAHGDSVIAEEEREHVELWREFAASLGTDIGEPSTPEVASLVAAARGCFSEAASSLGGLFAFECQQPYTASSKLEGLEKHYSAIKGGRVYFEVHQSDFEEPALLLQRMESLPVAEQQQAIEACRTMARSLFVALEALYDRYGEQCSC